MAYHIAKGPKNQNVETPKELFEQLNTKYKFTHDPCPYLGEWKEGIPDGLTTEWGTSNFINPPFNEVQEWLVKGYEQSLKNKLCVFLLPVRTECGWFHRFCVDGRKPRNIEIDYFRGGIKFERYKKKAPWACMLVIMHPVNKFQPVNQQQEINPNNKRIKIELAQ
jgi:hypothetical protein